MIFLSRLKELTEFKKIIMCRLNKVEKFYEPVQLPSLSRQYTQEKPKLGVLLSSISDVTLLIDVANSRD